jgi:5-methylcytosine-specific restriction protein B
MDRETLQAWVGAIERKKQAVLYGPPGTGKTYVAGHLAKHLIGGGDGFVELVLC